MKRSGALLFLLTVFAAQLLIGTALWAQEATGKIIGTVADPQGAVMPGAKVTVTNALTGVASNTTTDKDGLYQVLHLPIGKYKVTASKAGFQTVVTQAYGLEINQSLRIDVALPVGTTNETIEVTGNASMVETYNSTIGNSVTERPIINMPLDGRNVLKLAMLEPGVAERNPGDAGNGASFSIAGGRSDSVTFLLDGGNNNNLLDNGVVFNPNPDTVAEFRILESNYGAEYGRNAGGIISVVTKSGTNQFHGSAFEFVRNNALNANTFFNKVNKELQPDVLAADPKAFDTPILKRNQFGGTFGGPIKKEKLFFFVGYQGQRLTEQQNVGPLQTFTTRELGGDFSQSTYGVQPWWMDAPVPAKDLVVTFLNDNPWFQPDPVKRAQGIIDPTRIDPVAQKYIAAGLIPATTNGVLISKANAKSNFDELTSKFDWNFSQNDRLAATLGWNRAPGTRPFGGGATTPFPVNDLYKTYFLNVAYTKSFSTNLLNEARVTAQRLNASEGVPATKLPTSNALGILNNPDLATGPSIIYFYDSQILSGFSYRGPLDKVNNTFGYSDTLSWVKGRHTMKFGGSFSPYQNNTIYAYEVNGEFDFYGTGTESGSGTEFADFLFGAPDEYYQYGNAPSNVRSKSYAGFFQDEWRVTPRLVLNFGMRYEYNSPKRDTLGRSFSFKWGAHSQRFTDAPQGLLFPGDPGAPDGANFPDKNDFAPRLGFAWSPFASNKTSIRGGIGVFYDVLKGEDNLQFNGQAPFFGYSDIYFSYPTAATGLPYMTDPYGSTGTGNPFPSKWPAKDINFDANGFLPFAGPSVYFVDPNLRTPYTYHYNLSVQHELPGAYMANISYVGSTAHKLTSIVDNNPFTVGTNKRIFNTQPDALSYSWSYVDTFKNVVNQSYNSLQTSLKKQMTNGQGWFGSSYFTLAYTWAKNIDNASGFRNNSSRVPYYQPNLFRSVSDMDVTHRISFSGGWDIPFQNAWSSGPRRLTKGWSLYPILTWRTGFPIDIRGFLPRKRTTPGPSGAGDPNLVRPNLNGSGISLTNPFSNINQYGALYVPLDNFNLDYTAGVYTYGTTPRNAFRGPGRTNMDMAIAKTTPLTERSNLELRLEMFNVFNHTQFDNPSTNPTLPSTFGRINSTADPRILQLGVRFTF